MCASGGGRDDDFQIRWPHSMDKSSAADMFGSRPRRSGAGTVSQQLAVVRTGVGRREDNRLRSTVPYKRAPSNPTSICQRLPRCMRNGLGRRKTAPHTSCVASRLKTSQMPSAGQPYAPLLPQARRLRFRRWALSLSLVCIHPHTASPCSSMLCCSATLEQSAHPRPNSTAAPSVSGCGPQVHELRRPAMEIATNNILARTFTGAHSSHSRTPTTSSGGTAMHAQASEAYYSAFPHNARTSDSTQNTTYSSATNPSTATSVTPSPSPGPNGSVSATNNVINSVGNKDASLFQICVNLRNRLINVPGFEEQLLEVENADDDMDPVTLLWRTFRKGHPLVTLFNYLRPNDAIKISDDGKEERRSKSASFKFLQGCIAKLGFPADGCFIISDLYGEDTGGFAKVVNVVTRVADLMIREGLLTTLDANGSDAVGAPGMKKTHRQHIVDELVRTERTYVSHLEMLQAFKKLVEQRGIITGDAVHDIFLNLNALLDFQRRFLIRVEQTNAQPEPEQNWGRLFLSFGDGFEVYEPYIQNQKRCEAVTMQEFPRFKEAGGSLEMRQIVESPTHLTAFLLKPFQRLSKYPLLLKELKNKGDTDEDQKEDLTNAIAAVVSVLERANAYLAKEERNETVQDLKGQVEDWKGHRVEAFGSLLLHGTFTVHKGDPNKDEREKIRQYKMFLFEKILLCCKEVNPLKQKRMMNKPPPVDKRGRPRLQLKGRIFMQNVTDTTSSVGPNGYTCSIFWRGDETIEFFVIRFTAEDVMTKWRDQVECQRRVCQESLRNTLPSNTSETEFTYLRGQAQLENPYADEAGEEDEEYVDGSGFSISRNGSSTSLRSRSTTGESSRAKQAAGIGQPLALRTQNMNGPSPGDRGPNSYFSPSVESPISSRGSGASGVFPFPRQTTPSNGWHHDDPNRYTAPAMGRPMDPRVARAPNAPYVPHANALASRMRSASSPDIHAAILPARTGNTPPVPSIPAQLPKGPAAARSQNNSPLVNGAQQRPGTSGVNISGPRNISGPFSQIPDGPYRRSGTGRSDEIKIAPSINGDMASPSQIKVKVKVPSEGSTMTLVVGFNISYQTLKERIDAKMSRYTALSLSAGTVKLKYVDEGEFVSIQNDEDVQTAFEMWREQQMEASPAQFGEIELYCQR
ncbi:hypothetical protein FH972_021490 [Carpinus fangiana]|uniref:DH domain-containing protein n=1 Tax=Carpinus fangiana TaxID=176857 RepID=A0A5N6KRN4_9ROSI|nr:hypothetical protein FH972_021490 [Carpinus fangiana]